VAVLPYSSRLLAGLLAVTGVTHFAAPGFYDALVPRALPGSVRAWTYMSGVAELAVGAAVAHQRTRGVGGAAAAGLFVAVFTANVKMAADGAAVAARESRGVRASAGAGAVGVVGGAGGPVGGRLTRGDRGDKV
jgi:uncharacterized membrane protein